MTKAGMRRPGPDRGQPENDVNPVPEVRGKSKAKGEKPSGEKPEQ